MIYLIIILSVLCGISITTNVFLLFFLRIKYADCGNIFKIFTDNNVARKVAQKKFVESTTSNNNDKDFWGD